jgi:peptidoglycan/xylan/chitin deacetylase (PgdA/CDA1 family)
VDRGADAESPDARLTSEELATLAAQGVAIGSHALTHRSLARLPPETQRTEVERSRAVLESVTGRPIRAFAYPFGTRADYSDATTAMLRAAGYRFAFTSQHGAVTSGVDSLALPRVKVEGGERLWMFRAIVHGGMDGWRWVDRFFWRLQATP